MSDVYTFHLVECSLYIDGELRQIADDDTIYCPKCHEPILYWQVPFSTCYADKPINIGGIASSPVDDYYEGVI